MNEEEIKVKYVLPWLEQSGVELHEIQLERTFSLKIGRQSVRTGQIQPRKSNIVSGRLDILVQRNGRNLLIVETKAEGLQLTDDDRDQAISYARLVHPIAPYAVVTNGRSYKLYNSVTKTQIDPTDINVRGFEISLPDDDILEAQSLFLTLSPTNLIAFCRSQVASELRIVKGCLADGKKYVPEIHIPRESILKEVMEFYRSPLPGLMITGQSGSGKTSEMCWLAEYLLDKGRPVLFFNGVALEAGILEAIASEFSWGFNGSDQPVQIVRRMAKLAGSERLTIIVDAIDEWIYASREKNLGTLLRAAEHNNVKIILSCKTSSVEQFISARGTPSNVGMLSRKVEIGIFSEKEFFSAIDKYRQAYQFFGNFEDVVLDEARSNPFMLRVLFDVANNSKLKHLTFSSAEFFETYFRRSVSWTADERQAENTLKAIADLMYQHNADWIPEDDVRTSMGLRITESIMEELFEYGILLRNETQAGVTAIGFYFQQLRDYIIAFKVCRFDTMAQQQLENEFRQVMRVGSRTDVFTLYYRLASTERKTVFDHELRKNATSYLYHYTSLIEQHFPELREIFEPQTEGRIGFIGELFLVGQSLGAYGFRAIGNAENVIHFIPVVQGGGKSNLSYLEGANQLHWTSRAGGFRDGININTEIIDGELLPQLEQFIKEGQLNESQCPEMLEEFIIETIMLNRAVFTELLEADGRAIKYPIKLDKILRLLLREKLIKHYRNELISVRRKNGEIKEAWNGGFVSYSCHLTAEDEQQVSEATEKALASGNVPEFRSHDVDLDKLEGSLMKAINWLYPVKAVIEGPLFNGEVKLKTNVKKGNCILQEEAKAYLVWLYSTFIVNYKSIIETNFPTLKQNFRIYSILPATIYFVFKEPKTNQFGRSITLLGKYFSESKSSFNEVKVVDDLVLKAEDSSIFISEGTEIQVKFVIGGTFENLFSGINDPFKEMTLRRLIYQTIADELKDVKKSFRIQCKK